VPDLQFDMTQTMYATPACEEGWSAEGRGEGGEEGTGGEERRGACIERKRCDRTQHGIRVFQVAKPESTSRLLTTIRSIYPSATFLLDPPTPVPLLPPDTSLCIHLHPAWTSDGHYIARHTHPPAS